jgi:hypothetical protein
LISFSCVYAGRVEFTAPAPFRKYECPFAAQWSGRVAAATDLVIAIQNRGDRI